jgi:hypothetical protein
MPLGVANGRHGANYQHLPKVAVAGSRDPAETLLAAARGLLWALMPHRTGI